MIKIQKTTAENLQIARKCEQIAKENLIQNGGELHFSKTVYECDEIYYLTINETIIGYAAIKYGYRLKDDAYVMQIAIKKQYQAKGYGTAIYNYLKKEIKHCKYITCDIKNENIKSINFHLKNGFIKEQFINLSLYIFNL